MHILQYWCRSEQAILTCFEKKVTNINAAGSLQQASKVTLPVLIPDEEKKIK